MQHRESTGAEAGGASLDSRAGVPGGRAQWAQKAQSPAEGTLGQDCPPHSHRPFTSSKNSQNRGGVTGAALPGAPQAAESTVPCDRSRADQTQLQGFFVQRKQRGLHKNPSLLGISSSLLLL